MIQVTICHIEESTHVLLPPRKQHQSHYTPQQSQVNSHLPLSALIELKPVDLPTTGLTYSLFVTASIMFDAVYVLASLAHSGHTDCAVTTNRSAFPAFPL